MARILEWKCTHFDTAVIPAGNYPAGTTLATFFHDDSSVNEGSITEKQERDLVNELFAWHHFRALLFKELNIRVDSLCRTHVVSPIIDNPQVKPGDIDVLICEPGKPNESVALECKRVKVTAVSTLDDDVHKINDIKDGASQTKAMRRMGFHRTYLAVLIQVDGRNRKDVNTLFRGLNSSATYDGEQKTLNRIYEFPQRSIFHEDVGFVFVEVIQPTGKSFTKTGGICLRIEKDAKRLEQPDNLTNRITSLMSVK
jgi:hypothetical protein